jgi:hypothetical protein
MFPFSICSASVRRTSMREKSAISWKEAREEAQRLRETAGNTEEEEEEGVDGSRNKVPLTNGVSTAPHSFHAFLQMASVQTSDTSDAIPATNIDDVHLSADDDPPPPPPTVHQPAPQPTSTSDSNMNQVASPSSNQLPPQESPAEPPPIDNVPATPKAPLTPSVQSLASSVSSSRAPESNERKNSTGSMAPPSGTLADLKKQRAQRLQDALRSRDGSLSESPAYTPTSSGSNGHAVEMNGIQAPYEPPIHKYTTKSEIVGGNSSDTSCCVIL